MKTEKYKISNSQMMFMSISFIQGAHLTIGFMSDITGRDIWAAVIAAFLVSLIFISIYIKLAQKFSGKSLIQINDILYPGVIAKFISLVYILFFFMIGVENLVFTGRFILSYVLPETPLWVVVTMVNFVCGWAVLRGIEVIARCCFLFSLISASAVLVVTLLVAKDMDFSNLQPFFETSLKRFIQGAHVIATIPFCEILVFLMLAPNIGDIKGMKKSILLGVSLSFIQLLVIAIRDVAVLGPLISIIVSPSFETTRVINIYQIITRLDILIAIVLIISMFVKISIFYYAVTKGLAELFKLNSYTYVIVPVGIVMINLSIMTFGSSAQSDYAAAHIWPSFALLFEFIIPPVSLIIAQIKGMNKKREEVG
ncbi:spore germination protein KB [Anaerobacterium chartisolvens]|uniref:Spore germination protein KB n=1 Tax=Anaerobacterium chartisolvens TaxID=1297424 RepID=A0A369BHD3_9FIRM|nr:endospore germination permease [Anaerobacterium chartisolvens]RCX20972.1 spore germination protein KB [Anaerobacterium chartisolvens]